MPTAGVSAQPVTDYPRSQIQSMRDRLTTLDPDDPITADEADLLLEVSDEIDLLGKSQYSDQRHEFLLKRGIRIAEHTDELVDAMHDRDAAEAIVRWIHQTYDNPESNKDYRVTLRMLGDLGTDNDGKPDSIDWIPGGYPSTYDPAPTPEEMYRWEEHIQPMLDACHNSRDRCLIALAWDLGPRPSELFDLTVDRFTDDDLGMRVTLHQGKQGTRSPLLIPSAPYVRQWLGDHPADRGSDTALWTRVNACDPISNNRVRDIIKEKAAAAEMVPPASPTPRRLRKSSASFLASQGVSQAHLEQHHGWVSGSQVASRYIAVFDDANRREIAKAHGVDVAEETGEATGPVECPRCGRETPREHPVCMWCNQVLPHAPDAQASVDEIQASAAADLSERELTTFEQRLVGAVLDRVRGGHEESPPGTSS